MFWVVLALQWGNAGAESPDAADLLRAPGTRGGNAPPVPAGPARPSAASLIEGNERFVQYRVREWKLMRSALDAATAVSRMHVLNPSERAYVVRHFNRLFGAFAGMAPIPDADVVRRIGELKREGKGGLSYYRALSPELRRKVEMRAGALPGNPSPEAYALWIAWSGNRPENMRLGEIATEARIGARLAGRQRARRSGRGSLRRPTDREIKLARSLTDALGKRASVEEIMTRLRPELRPEVDVAELERVIERRRRRTPSSSDLAWDRRIAGEVSTARALNGKPPRNGRRAARWPAGETFYGFAVPFPAERPGALLRQAGHVAAMDATADAIFWLAELSPPELRRLTVPQVLARSRAAAREMPDYAREISRRVVTEYLPFGLLAQGGEALYERGLRRAGAGSLSQRLLRSWTLSPSAAAWERQALVLLFAIALSDMTRNGFQPRQQLQSAAAQLGGMAALHWAVRNGRALLGTLKSGMAAGGAGAARLHPADLFVAGTLQILLARAEEAWGSGIEEPASRGRLLDRLAAAVVRLDGELFGRPDAEVAAVAPPLRAFARAHREYAEFVGRERSLPERNTPQRRPAPLLSVPYCLGPRASDPVCREALRRSLERQIRPDLADVQLGQFIGSRLKRLIRIYLRAGVARGEAP